MATKYGKTWWGEQWLGALKNIDYSNRLPRGASYQGEELTPLVYVDDNKYYIELKCGRGTCAIIAFE